MAQAFEREDVVGYLWGVEGHTLIGRDPDGARRRRRVAYVKWIKKGGWDRIAPVIVLQKYEKRLQAFNDAASRLHEHEPSQGPQMSRMEDVTHDVAMPPLIAEAFELMYSTFSHCDTHALDSKTALILAHAQS